MHEVALMQSIFDLINKYSREYQLKKVSRIVVRIGVLSNVLPAALHFAFDAMQRGTIAEGADFVMEMVAARSQCTVCGHEFAADLRMCSCPACDEPAIIITGQELHLQTLEGDQGEEKDGN